MKYSGARWKMIHVKNLSWKISCQRPCIVFVEKYLMIYVRSTVFKLTVMIILLKGTVHLVVLTFRAVLLLFEFLTGFCKKYGNCLFGTLFPVV
jgi:hypothetical protein